MLSVRRSSALGHPPIGDLVHRPRPSRRVPVLGSLSTNIDNRLPRTALQKAQTVDAISLMRSHRRSHSGHSRRVRIISDSNSPYNPSGPEDNSTCRATDQPAHQLAIEPATVCFACTSSPSRRKHCRARRQGLTTTPQYYTTPA
jgi:hypothetical protein